MFSFWKPIPKKIDPQNSGNLIILGKDNISNVAGFLAGKQRRFFKSTCRFVNEVCSEVPVYWVMQNPKWWFFPHEAIYTIFSKLAYSMNAGRKKESLNEFIDDMYLIPKKANERIKKMDELHKQEENFFPDNELGIVKLYVPRHSISSYKYGFIIDPKHRFLVEDIECIDVYYPEPWSIRNPHARILIEKDLDKTEEYRSYCTIS